MDTVLLPPVEDEVRRLGALMQQGRHAEALADAHALLPRVPENRDVLLAVAGALRHLGRIDEALAMLDRLEALQPRFSLLHQERGLCHVARKDAPAATQALLTAVNLNPALPMSWRMLEGVYRIAGDTANAATAAAHVATLKQTPPEVVRATALFFDGDLLAAERMVRDFLLAHGDHPEAMRLLARIGVARDVLDDADLLLEAALVLAPDHHAARLDHADVLIKRHKYREAREQIARLQAVPQIDTRALAATVAIALGEPDQALVLYRSLLAEAPDSPDVNLWLGHMLKTVGEVPQAIDAYRKAAAARPQFGDAWWSLANLKTYRFQDGEIARMQADEAAPGIVPDDRIHMCFALGKALEDRGDYPGSWLYYDRGNALKRQASRYRPEIMETNTREQVRVCTAEFFAARAGWGDARPDPIFILGLPRSGSTLVEQILASHSLVEGTQELSEIPRMALELQGRAPDLDHPRYPNVLAEMTQQDFAALGARYLDETHVFRSGRPFFIDKMPNNFRHVGLIQLMLPNARIIDARREPMACCFSNFKQLFANGQEFTYGLEDIARYYRTYLELMRHWDAVLPGRVLRLQHEDVVADLEGSVRRLLDHCGLPFEQACVDFHANRRSVRTPSSEQVRRPIFRDSLEQWKHYTDWLGPLKEALGPALTDYRD